MLFVSQGRPRIPRTIKWGLLLLPRLFILAMLLVVLAATGDTAVIRMALVAAAAAGEVHQLGAPVPDGVTGAATLP